MKPFLLILLFCGLVAITDAQVIGDFPSRKLASTSTELNFDSIQQELLPDTLLPSFQKIDSIQSGFNLTADRIQTNYQTTVSTIDSEAKELQNTIDSLQNVKLPTTQYRKCLDSLKDVRLNFESKVRTKVDSLKAQTIDQLRSLDLPAQYKEPLESLTKNIGDLKVNGDIIKIPKLEMPGYSLPEIDGMGNLASNAGEITDIQKISKLSKIDSPLGDVGQLSQQAKGYQEDIKQVTQGNLQDAQALPETIEEHASKMDGMDELKETSGIIDEHKTKLDDLKDPEKAKEQVVTTAKKAAVDHFAGKQEQLRAEMEKVSKYKQKYSSVSSIKDLPKRPPNPMRAKPLIERLVPGLYLQYQQKNFYILDVNPYVGYKLSGRLATGLGWNHRYSYDKDSRSFSSRSRIFGPRAYVDFKLGKGFIAHLEGESMNSFVPSTLRGNPDSGHREWVWTFMTGLKKEYKIYKNLQGTALIQYNLFNRYYKAPYVDRLNSRIGFEYVLKRKRK